PGGEPFMTSGAERHDGEPDVRRGASSTVATLFSARARVHPDRVAIEDGARIVTYRELDDRSSRLAGVLAARGVGRGARVAILSANRGEYLEVFLAAARLGAVVACQSWRLAPPELAHCLDLVEPTVVLASPRHAAKIDATKRTPILFGDEYERAIAA